MRSWWLVIACACGGDDGAVPPDAATDAEVDASPDAAVPVRLVAYVGGGPTIAWYDVDQTTGALSPIASMPAFRSGVQFLAMHGTTSLFAVTSGNRLGAYAIDPVTAALTFRNDVPSGGNGPTHLSVDKTGKFVFVANYSDGNIAVMPIEVDGRIGMSQQILLAGANAHLIDSDPSNRFVVVPCLGSDHVAQYLFDASTGMLTANAVPNLATVNGAGPRHLAFSPDGTHAYLINELNSTLSALAFDTTTGRLSELHTVSTRASGATGSNTTAEVVVHPSGKFVYGSNRGDDNIAVFSIEAGTGRIAVVDHTSTQGMTPRNFTVDPTGKFLYAANQSSGSVVPFAIDTSTGRLTPTAAPITAATPQFVGIVAFPI